MRNSLTAETIPAARELPSEPLRGWGLVLLLWGIAIALAWGVLATAGSEYAGTWLNLKLTARWSFLIFLLIYIARPAHQLWRTAFTKQLLARRRLLGLGFALAHYTHLTLIIYLFSLAAPGAMPLMSTGKPMALVVPVGGTFAYVLITGMFITSFNTPKVWMRKLHPQAWKYLHRLGIHYLMFIFTLDWIEGLLIKSPWWAYAPFLLASLAAIGLRVRVHRITRLAPRASSEFVTLQLRSQ